MPAITARERTRQARPPERHARRCKKKTAIRGYMQFRTKKFTIHEDVKWQASRGPQNPPYDTTQECSIFWDFSATGDTRPQRRRARNSTAIQDVVMTLYTDFACCRRHNRMRSGASCRKSIAGRSRPCIFKLLPRWRKFSVNGLSTNSSTMRTGDMCLESSISKNSRTRPRWRKTCH